MKLLTKKDFINLIEDECNQEDGLPEREILFSGIEGVFEIVDEYRGDSGDHDTWHMVYKVVATGQLFMVEGYYSSHNGIDFDYWQPSVKEVELKEVVRQEYVEKKIEKK